MPESYREFEATSLFCPRCRKAVAVRKKLLLVLPTGTKYDYLCAECGAPVGGKTDNDPTDFYRGAPTRPPESPDARSAAAKPGRSSISLAVVMDSGAPGVTPGILTVLDQSYPISRPMFMYTPGHPPSHVKKYLDFILGEAGQKIVAQTGYIPLPKK
jgi:hypothetical protein